MHSIQSTISTSYTLGLKELKILDLSYNALSKQSISLLTSLPQLQKLDLAGNNIRELPVTMREFKALEILNLEENLLSYDNDIRILSLIPKLRKLNLSRNSFNVVNNEETYRDIDNEEDTHCFLITEVFNCL